MFSFSLICEENILNQIENDHRIRNFAFLGPFSSSFNTDSLINEMSLQSFSIHKKITVDGQYLKWKKPPQSSGSLGFHNVFHYYPEIKTGDVVIAVANVSSKSVKIL